MYYTMLREIVSAWCDVCRLATCVSVLKLGPLLHE